MSDNLKLVYTRKEAASAMGVSLMTLIRHIDDGRIKVLRLSPRCIRIRKTEIEAFMSSVEGTK